MVDTPDCESGRCGFESRRSPHFFKVSEDKVEELLQNGWQKGRKLKFDHP